MQILPGFISGHFVTFFPPSRSDFKRSGWLPVATTGRNAYFFDFSIGIAHFFSFPFFVGSFLVAAAAVAAAARRARFAEYGVPWLFALSLPFFSVRVAGPSIVVRIVLPPSLRDGRRLTFFLTKKRPKKRPPVAKDDAPHPEHR
jgi:hypothetical protein